MKRIKALCYTKGYYGKGFRETVDTDNENLYSMGRYPTKIRNNPTFKILYTRITKRRKEN